MWIVELISTLGSGLGTELGWFNMALLITLGFFTKREWNRQKKKWADIPDDEFRKQHSILWEAFAKRALEQSGRHSLPGDKELLSEYIMRLTEEKSNDK